MLPHIDGFTLGKELLLLRPETPSSYLGVKNQTEDVVRGFKIGANDYLKKPISVKELLVRIENLLKLTSTEKSTKGSWKIGQYTFNDTDLTLKFNEVS